jgi:hypothetical protein
MRPPRSGASVGRRPHRFGNDWLSVCVDASRIGQALLLEDHTVAPGAGELILSGSTVGAPRDCRNGGLVEYGPGGQIADQTKVLGLAPDQRRGRVASGR